MATLEKPKLLLLDEHTAALDPKISKAILALTDNVVREQHVTTLMITHNLQHALAHGNKLVILDRGKIRFQASGEEKKKLSIDEVLRYMEGGVEV